MKKGKVNKTTVALYSTILLFSLYVIIIYLIIGADNSGFVKGKLNITGFKLSVWEAVFYPHLFLGLISLFIGPFQLTERSRKNLKVHKNLGRLYGVTILLNVLCVPYLALYATGGKASTFAFIVLDLLWLITTAMGVIRAYQRNFVSHEVWIKRSYAITWVFVTFRIVVSGLAILMDVSYAFPVSVYLSIVLNLIVVESIRMKKNTSIGKRNPSFLS